MSDNTYGAIIDKYLLSNTSFDMRRLVMIDDNQIEHLIMQKMFDRYELFHNADHASDGRVIIDLLSKEETHTTEIPDIIFLDLHMPDFSGWDFLEQFEKLQQSLKKSVRIYIVSSSVNPEDIARAKKYPFVHDFITKPVKRDLLDSLYASYLDRIAS